MKVPELMTSADVAVFLAVSESQVNRLAADGRLSAALRSPGKRGVRFFHRDEVTRIAAERNLAP